MKHLFTFTLATYALLFGLSAVHSVGEISMYLKTDGFDPLTPGCGLIYHDATCSWFVQNQVPGNDVCVNSSTLRELYTFKSGGWLGGSVTCGADECCTGWAKTDVNCTQYCTSLHVPAFTPAKSNPRGSCAPGNCTFIGANAKGQPVNYSYPSASCNCAPGSFLDSDGGDNPGTAACLGEFTGNTCHISTLVDVYKDRCEDGPFVVEGILPNGTCGTWGTKKTDCRTWCQAKGFVSGTCKYKDISCFGKNVKDAGYCDCNC